MDNGINRRGQKVECIGLFEVVTHRPSPVTVPQPGQVYTVSDFMLSGRVVSEEPGDHLGEAAPGITLLEVPIPRCTCCGQTMGWPIIGFRPVVSSETKADISALKELAAGWDAPVDDEVGASAIVSDEEIAHLEQCFANPAGPSPAVLQGQQLLRELRKRRR